jgi:hypothetical protein
MIRQLSGWTVFGASAILASCLLCQAASAAGSTRSGYEGDPVVVRSFVSSLDRASVVDIHGLDNPALRLTARQQTEVEAIIRSYLEAYKKITAKFPAVRGEFPTADSIIARQDALVKFTTDLRKLMNDEQRKTWETAQAARLKPRDPNGGFHQSGN